MNVEKMQRPSELPRDEFPSGQHRAWLLDDELAIWNAMHCQDIEANITCGVRLKRFHGKRKRGKQEAPKTDEERARLSAASSMLDARFRGYCNRVSLLSRLAIERRQRAEGGA